MKTHLSKTGMKLFQLPLVTPMMRLEAMGKARNFMSQAAAKRIMAAMIEAERYVDGERAQLGMAL